jgi:hypothetical protein
MQDPGYPFPHPAFLGPDLVDPPTASPVADPAHDYGPGGDPVLGRGVVAVLESAGAEPGAAWGQGTVGIARACALTHHLWLLDPGRTAAPENADD